MCRLLWMASMAANRSETSPDNDTPLNPGGQGLAVVEERRNEFYLRWNDGGYDVRRNIQVGLYSLNMCNRRVGFSPGGCVSFSFCLLGFPGCSRVWLAGGTGITRPIPTERPSWRITPLARCTMASSNCAGIRPRTPGGPGSELSATIGRNPAVSEGYGHRFITLADHSEVLYSRATWYLARATHGIPWNEPVVGIEWSEPEWIIPRVDRAMEALEDIVR